MSAARRAGGVIVVDEPPGPRGRRGGEQAVEVALTEILRRRRLQACHGLCHGVVAIRARCAG